MDKLSQQKQRQMLEIATMGNADAISLMEIYGSISQTWDDLIDKDRAVTDKDINSMMWLALVDIPQNVFFQRYALQLMPTIRQCIFDWHDANTMEKEGRQSRAVSFVLRDSLAALVIQSAYLIGGEKHAGNISAMVRKHIHDDPINEYLGDE